MRLISRGRNLMGFHGGRNLSQCHRNKQCNPCRTTLGRKAWVSAFWLSSIPKEVSSILNKWLAVKHTVILSSPSQPSSHTSDGSGTLLSSSTESHCNSNQGSGNEDGLEASYIIYEESSSEVGFLLG